MEGSRWAKSCAYVRVGCSCSHRILSGAPPPHELLRERERERRTSDTCKILASINHWISFTDTFVSMSHSALVRTYNDYVWQHVQYLPLDRQDDVIRLQATGWQEHGSVWPLALSFTLSLLTAESSSLVSPSPSGLFTATGCPPSHSMCLSPLASSPSGVRVSKVVAPRSLKTAIKRVYDFM